jgi:hypothetical protein
MRGMGGQPWMYFVPYERDLQAALEKLRARELHAGRYHPVMRDLPFPVLDDSPAPGGGHRSVAEARDAADADGTRSILDMDRVVTRPRPRRPSQDEMFAAMSTATHGDVVDLDALSGFMPQPEDFGTIAPVVPELLEELYGTARPRRPAVQAAPRFLDDVDRGMGVYVVLYEDDVPTEICFAGYSYD